MPSSERPDPAPARGRRGSLERMPGRALTWDSQLGLAAPRASPRRRCKRNQITILPFYV
jgi:hypothetical protein